MTIYNEADLKQAIIQKESPIVVEDKTIGDAFMVAGRIQGGLLPKVVSMRLFRILCTKTRILVIGFMFSVFLTKMVYYLPNVVKS